MAQGHEEAREKEEGDGVGLMGDLDLRELERSASADPSLDAQARLLQARLKGGLLEHGEAGVELAAYVGDEIARLALGVPPGWWMSTDTLSGLCWGPPDDGDDREEESLPVWAGGIHVLAPEFWVANENIGPRWWTAQAVVGVAWAAVPTWESWCDIDPRGSCYGPSEPCLACLLARGATVAADVWLACPCQKHLEAAVRAADAVNSDAEWAKVAAYIAVLRYSTVDGAVLSKSLGTVTEVIAKTPLHRTIRERLVPMALKVKV